ncbi:MAG: ATP-binding protein [Pyrinomonadaceae bacterium]
MNETYEKLGLFYLGKDYDPEKQNTTENYTLYESKHLVTHGVCMGMTGSGKTGLCLSILEEAAIDGVPVIAIDPKGDLTNLFLTFPNLAPSDFQPWVSADEASQKGISVEELAAQTADLWKNGLAKWDEAPERIKLFSDSVERKLYTPGSSAGIPISILRSFEKPESVDDLEAVSERVSTLVSGLLGLIGIDADPLTDKQHILLSNIIQNEWLAGRSVTVEQLIALVQSPPMNKIGAFDLEAYYPKDERFKLAMQINNLLASPQFAAWTQGEGLNIGNLLHNESGKPKVSVVSIAHLSDQERMFFVTLLLNELVSWMRAQSGTGSLRCLLYMDEIFGYLPPVANPPSKRLFLTLLKQARAFGVGLLLATQNPGDLDYKALSNVGTWFIGRLQTERDKEKVLEGLVTANSGADENEISKQLSGLGKRIFMLNDTSESHPILFETRWALSYLAGPIMRNRFKELPGGAVESNAGTEASATGAGGGLAATGTVAEAVSQPVSRPILDPAIPQIFVPGAGTAYQPVALGAADVLYKDAKLGISESREVMYVAPLADFVTWTNGEQIEYTVNDLESDPRTGYGFQPLTAEVSAKTMKVWENDFKDFLYKTKPLVFFKCELLGSVSQPNEDERAFRIRLSQEARERRDEFIQRIRDEFAKDIDTLSRQKARAEEKAATQASQASSQTLGTAITIGTSLLGSIFGSRRSYGTAISSSTSKISTTMKERREAADAAASVEEIDARLAEIETQIQTKVDEFQNSDLIEIQNVEILPKKTDINVRKVALGWKPIP